MQLVSFVDSTTGDVQVDCKGIDFIGSTGLDILVKVHHGLAHEGRQLILARTTPWFRRLLEITELDRISRRETR